MYLHVILLIFMFGRYCCVVCGYLHGFIFWAKGFNVLGFGSNGCLWFGIGVGCIGIRPLRFWCVVTSVRGMGQPVGF